MGMDCEYNSPQCGGDTCETDYCDGGGCTGPGGYTYCVASGACGMYPACNVCTLPGS